MKLKKKEIFLKFAIEKIFEFSNKTKSLKIFLKFHFIENFKYTNKKLYLFEESLKRKTVIDVDILFK